MPGSQMDGQNMPGALPNQQQQQDPMQQQQGADREYHRRHMQTSNLQHPPSMYPPSSHGSSKGSIADMRLNGISGRTVPLNTVQNSLHPNNNFMNNLPPNIERAKSPDSFLKKVFMDASSPVPPKEPEMPITTRTSIFDDDVPAPSIHINNKTRKSVFDDSPEEKKEEEIEKERRKKLEEEEKNKKISYEVTDADRKNYLAFLGSPVDPPAEIFDPKALEKFTYKEEVIEEKPKVKKVEEEKNKANSKKIDDKDDPECQGLINAMNFYEHSPGEVYTILEDEDEASSPTAPDGVSRPRRKGKNKHKCQMIIKYNFYLYMNN